MGFFRVWGLPMSFHNNILNISKGILNSSWDDMNFMLCLNSNSYRWSLFTVVFWRLCSWCLGFGCGGNLSCLDRALILFLLTENWRMVKWFKGFYFTHLETYKNILHISNGSYSFINMLFIGLCSDRKVIFALLSGTLPFAAKTELDPKSHPSSLWDEAYWTTRYQPKNHTTWKSQLNAEISNSYNNLMQDKNKLTT